MKTETEVKEKIREIESDFAHVLKGSAATIVINGPRALQQVSAEGQLSVLYWVVGKKFKSKLRGVDC